MTLELINVTMFPSSEGHFMFTGERSSFGRHGSLCACSRSPNEVQGLGQKRGERPELMLHFFLGVSVYENCQALDT